MNWIREHMPDAYYMATCAYREKLRCGVQQLGLSRAYRTPHRDTIRTRY